MSLILDALKKLEREKSLQREGPRNLVPEVVRTRPEPRSRQRWLLPLGIAAAAILSVLVTLLLVRPPSGVTPPEPEAVRDMPVAVAPVNQVPPVSPAPVTTPPPQATTLPTPPAMPRSVEGTAMATPHRAPMDDQMSEQEEAPATASQPSVTVSGIAWADARHDRRAVINGALVSEGATIGGARLVEIQQNRVIFSSGGRRYSVSQTPSPLK